MRTAALLAGLVALLGLTVAVSGEDPYIFFDWNVTYGTIAPLGVPQRVILINGQFPGPNINSTTNNNVVVNLFNNLDEPFLLSWNGIQHRKNSWQDGMPGTNCPIPPGGNFTYHFQVKDQIGSFYYFPSTAMHKAAGGFGGLRVNSRLLIPVPFDPPADDFTVLIGDWYAKDHSVLRGRLNRGRSLGRPNGVLINGKKDDPKPLFTMEAGKTYRYRVCNVGMKTSLNFRIQGHDMKLVEMDGSHTVQNVYGSLDVHAGQCYSVLVTANQEPRGYYMVASTRFLKKAMTTTAVVGYAGCTEAPSPDLPEAPVGWAWSINQWRSFRWNLTASAARPNPQGSYHYGGINITRTIRLANSAGSTVDGKLRYAINGASFKHPKTPLKLAEYFGVGDKVFQYDTIGDVPPATLGSVIRTEPVVLVNTCNTIEERCLSALHSAILTVLKATFRDFVEIILENPERAIQSYHLDGYSFFPVGMGRGRWSPEKRKKYNLLDAVSRHTIQVYPRSWTAIMLTFDNAGMWNLRSEMWERHYLGQQLYFSVLSPARSLRDEYDAPANVQLCGAVQNLPRPPPYV